MGVSTAHDLNVAMTRPKVYFFFQKVIAIRFCKVNWLEVKFDIQIGDSEHCRYGLCH